ncbi:MAG: 50S ribosomal protein L21 [Candidatus Pacebacteria bacterium]|nr:50S ribosomal protein L21 [Candidatus Paceibacterota bacterium]
MEKDFAVVMTGGKQYKVSAGDKLQVEKLDAKEGEKVVFETVLLHAAADGAVKVGTPYIAGAKLEAKVLGDVRGKKKITFKYHSKTRARRKKGHRQDYTEIEIVKI